MSNISTEPQTRNQETAHSPENPYAFPTLPGTANFDVHMPGMTLRDYFAAACIGEITHALCCSGQFDYLAQRAYAIADAMLRARDQLHVKARGAL